MCAKVYSVISAIPQNGAKYVTTNLGRAMKLSNKKDRVILLDFDFYNPTLCHHYVKNSIYNLDNLEPFGSRLQEKDFINNVTTTNLGFDVLKGSGLCNADLFTREIIAKIINFAKMSYDHVFIVVNPDISFSSTVVSLLNSDEILLCVRNNYSNFVKISDIVDSISIFSQSKTIRVIENLSNYNDNINIMSKLKDQNVELMEILNYDHKSIDNIDLGRKSIFKNVNESKFKRIALKLKGESK